MGQATGEYAWGAHHRVEWAPHVEYYHLLGAKLALHSPLENFPQRLGYLKILKDILGAFWSFCREHPSLYIWPIFLHQFFEYTYTSYESFGYSGGMPFVYGTEPP